MLGSGVSSLAFPLITLALTHSPAQAGLVGAVFGLPYIVFSLPAGAYVDRWDRKRVMIICDTVRALNISSIPLAVLAGHLSIVQLYLAAAIDGTAFVFFNVAEVAALPRVVDKSQIADASSQNQAAQAAGLLVSPPLGGLLYQSLGRGVPFLADGISYAVSVFSLLFIKTEFQLDRTADHRHILVEIGEGVTWLWRQPLILYMSFLTGGLNFASNATFLILLILAKERGASPALIGVMFAITSIGALLGSIVAPRFQKRFGYAQVIISATWLQALIIPAFAIAPNIFVLGALGAVVFVTGPIYNAVQFSYRISIIPDELQGRVNSAVRLIAFGGMPLGLALPGVLIQTVGAVPAVLAFGGFEIALAAITSFNPHVRAAKSHPTAVPS